MTKKPPFKHRAACKLVEWTQYLSFRSAWKLAHFLSILFFPFRGQLQTTIRENIARVYPNLSLPEQQKLSQRSFRHTLSFALESGSVWLKPLEYGCEHITKIHGLSLLEEAQHSEQGIILILPHLGNWEMANQFIAPRADVVALYKPQPNQQLENHILNARSRAGLKMVPTQKRGVLQILKHLKQGGVTIILPDQVPETNGGIIAPFFGQDTQTATLVPKLAKSSQAHLIGLICARDEQGRFEVHLSKAPTAIADPDIKVAALTMNAYIESLVNQFPAQYQWSYKRFKSSSATNQGLLT